MKYKNIHSECKRGFSNDSSSRCCAARGGTVWRVQCAISLCLRRVLWSLFGSEAGMGKEGVFFLFPQTDRDTVQYWRRWPGQLLSLLLHSLGLSQGVAGGLGEGQEHWLSKLAVRPCHSLTGFLDSTRECQ